jgi:hypothetical protein
MTANLYQGAGDYTKVVGKNPMGQLPHPPIQGLKQGSFGPVMSDMQTMMSNEQKQHQEAYQYANGHNDHGMGQ